ncbi:glycosyltransferase family 2 protein [Microbacterium sp.]|uniref:glycosyltransferase family 2 protein n=1 Tax=Microbacterium sp. TaxID=51671 RepID=UPI0039E2574C
MDKLLVIVPAWNEERNVGTTVEEIRATLPESDILVVDDGSTDATGDEARAAGALVLTLPFNLGVGGAMRAGYSFAARNDYDATIQVDADGQHDPADIVRIVTALDEADIAIGARFADVGDYRARGPRRWAMTFLASTVSRVAHTRLTDVTSGFRAGNRRAIAQYVNYYPAEYLGDTIDSLVAAVHAGLSVTQVPVAMRPRRHGTPSQGFAGSMLYLMRSLLALGLAIARRPLRNRA